MGRSGWWWAVERERAQYALEFIHGKRRNRIKSLQILTVSVGDFDGLFEGADVGLADGELVIPMHSI